MRERFDFSPVGAERRFGELRPVARCADRADARPFGEGRRKGLDAREEALELLETTPYDEAQMEDDKEYIAKKLGISTEEFTEIIEGENKSPLDYKNEWGRISFAVKVAKLVGVESRNIR